MSSILQMLAQMQGDDDEPEVTMSIDGQIAHLREWLDDYGTVKFKIGDLVTPKLNSIVNGNGVPHIVLETRALADPYLSGNEIGSATFGARLNMRVALVHRNCVSQHWTEAHQWQHWVRPA